MSNVCHLVDETSVGTQVVAYTKQLRESIPARLAPDHVPGASLTLESATVFVPSHKLHKDFKWLRTLDSWTAIRGSEGEPESTSVLRPGSVVLVLDTFEEQETHRAWVAQSPPRTHGHQTLCDDVKMEVLARDHGRLLELQEPVRYVFGRVQVTRPAPHSATLLLTDPCGFVVECGDRDNEVAGAPDFTEGYLETPGVTGVIFLQAVCETMTWSLSPTPFPAHKDHDPSRNHEKLMRVLQSLGTGKHGFCKPKLRQPGRAGAKNFRRRQRRRDQHKTSGGGHQSW